MMQTTERLSMIENLLREHDIVLFMKGTRLRPQCGFSSRVVDILDQFLPHYHDVNVLADADLRDAIKEYSSWPTLPQLYVRGEFVGGCDILTEMHQSGELARVLGTTAIEVRAPEIFVSERALAALKEFQGSDESPTFRLTIGPDFSYNMDFDDADDGDIVTVTSDFTVLTSRKDAPKLDRVRIDFVDGPEGSGFKIDNPHEPAKVKPLSVQTLAQWRSEGKAFELIDVRTDEERTLASLSDARPIAEARGILPALDRAVPLVFVCHHGTRSELAALEALQLGFTEVWNVTGGIDAWSREIDPSLTRY